MSEIQGQEPLRQFDVDRDIILQRKDERFFTRASQPKLSHSERGEIENLEKDLEELESQKLTGVSRSDNVLNFCFQRIKSAISFLVEKKVLTFKKGGVVQET